jgi:hypothetical protein
VSRPRSSVGSIRGGPCAGMFLYTQGLPHKVATRPRLLLANASRGCRSCTFLGYGYDNLILHVEWAAPRAERG